MSEESNGSSFDEGEWDDDGSGSNNSFVAVQMVEKPIEEIYESEDEGNMGDLFADSSDSPRSLVSRGPIISHSLFILYIFGFCL